MAQGEAGTEKASRGSRRAATQAGTRERLLAAGLREVARRGAAASVRDIAAAAGLTQGALYANFAGKEGLLLELLRRHMAEEERSLAAALDGAHGQGAAALDAIEAWTTRLDGGADRPDWAAVGIALRLHAAGSAAFAREWDALHAAHRQVLGALVTRLFAMLGKPLPGEAEDIAEGFVALANGLAVGRSGGTRPGTAGRTVGLFLRALARFSGDPAGVPRPR
jgi:AcrR family transcriptional regulator